MEAIFIEKIFFLSNAIGFLRSSEISFGERIQRC
jgi:hypothetical protein